MALSEDQRALLRLLAQREQGYDDIAALMGLDVDEVRARVDAALRELNSEEKAPPARQAPPPEPPPAPAEPKAEEPAKPEPAEKPTPAPAATPPPSPSTPSPARSTSRPGWSALAKRQKQLIGALVGLGVVVIAAVLIATGAFNGSSSSSSSASNDSTTTTAASTNKQLTQATLQPVDGGSAQGTAIFGRVKSTAVLEVIAKGLDPSPAGQSYTVWLYRSPKVVLRIGSVKVGKSGGIGAQFPIPTQVLAYVANGAFDQVDISLTSDAAYKTEVALAKKQKRLPSHIGTDVLRGRITGPAVKG